MEKFKNKCFAHGNSESRVSKHISNFHSIFRLAPDWFEHGVFDQQGDLIEVTEKGEVQKDILHTTADQLVETGAEDTYRLAVYLARETEDFAYQRPHSSLEEFIEDNKVDQKAQQMMVDLI